MPKTKFWCHYGHFEFFIMPFAHTKTLTTFQSCVNNIFNKKLRKFLLVFFYDLLTYNKTWDDHLGHMDEILVTMQGQSLYAKTWKCENGMVEIIYLGHAISAKGIQVHREKIEAILDWLTPKNLTKIRGFFKIWSYYWQFFKGFSELSPPITDMTKKGAFR